MTVASTIKSLPAMLDDTYRPIFERVGEAVQKQINNGDKGAQIFDKNISPKLKGIKSPALQLYGTEIYTTTEFDDLAHFIEDNGFSSPTHLSLVNKDNGLDILSSRYEHAKKNALEEYESNSLQISVGEYGRALAAKLLETQRVIQKIVCKNFSRIFDNVKPNIAFWRSMRGHFGTRTKNQKNIQSIQTMAFTQVLDTFASVARSIALLTMQKIKGFDKPEDLVEHVCNKKFLQILSKANVVGVLNPISMSGKYIKDILLPDDRKGAVLNSKILKEMKKLQESSSTIHNKMSQALSGISVDKEDTMVFKGCPVGDVPPGADAKSSENQTSLVQRAAEIFLKVFKSKPIQSIKI